MGKDSLQWFMQAIRRILKIGELAFFSIEKFQCKDVLRRRSLDQLESPIDELVRRLFDDCANYHVG